MIDSSIYIHGGFDQEAPTIPTAQIIRLDLNRLFTGHSPLIMGLAM